MMKSDVNDINSENKVIDATPLPPFQPHPYELGFSQFENHVLLARQDNSDKSPTFKNDAILYVPILKYHCNKLFINHGKISY